MYPLNVYDAANSSFAVANDAAEHDKLTGQGFTPAYVAPPVKVTIESVRAQLDDLKIDYDKRMGLEKLIELLPA